MSHRMSYEELERRVQELEQALLMRKQADDVIRKSEERYRMIFNYSPLGIVHVDCEGRIVDCNEHFLEIVGAPRERVIGFNMVESAQDRKMKAAIVAGLAGEPNYFEGDYRSVTGNKITPVRAIYSEIISEDGKLLGAVGLIEDITERKQSEEYLRKIANAASDPICVLDREHRYVLANDAQCALAGRKREEIIGRTDYSFFPRQQVSVSWGKDELVFKTGNENEDEEEITDSKGNTRTVVTKKTLYTDRQGNKFIVSIMRDITRRKETELALQAAYHKLQDLMEFLPDATLVVDLDGKVIHWNRSMEEMTGVPKKDILGKGGYAYSVPFYGHERPMLIDLVLSEKPEIEKRYDFVKRIGTTVYGEAFVPGAYQGQGAYLWSTAAPLYDKNGSIIGFIQSIRDISDRKQAEDTVAQNEEKYRQLFATVSDAILIFDWETRCLIDVNERALSLYGYSRDEFLKLAHGDIAVTPDEWDTVAGEEAAGMMSQVPLRYHRRKDGVEFPVEISFSAFPVVERKVVCAVARDITERRRVEEELNRYRNQLEDLVEERTGELADANEMLTREMNERGEVEQALQESQRMLQLVLDTIPVRVFWKDLNSRFLGCNRPFALDAGLQSPEQIVGRSDSEMGWAEQAELYIADDRLVMETAVPKLGYEEPQTTPDGGKLWLRTNKIPLFDAKGQITGVLGTYEDITVHKRVEEALRDAHQELERRVQERTVALEKANEELRQIPSKLIAVLEEERKRLASELHDSIGQTLAAIKFRVEMILDLIDGGDCAAVSHHLEQFVPILQHSIEETRSIYMGLRPPMLDSVGLLATLEWLRRECMKLYPDRHVEFKTEVAEDEIPERLKMNIFRIAQEALNNIAKHSRAEWVDVMLTKDEKGIALVVSDDGVGMDLELVVRTSGVRNLGLTSMRERAELTGGNFRIESTPGQGTTINASWPTGLCG